MIFVALALLWAVFLIPKALKHHDEVARTRSVDEVSDSVRVLARREAVTERDARLVVGPMLTTKVTGPSAGPLPDAVPLGAPTLRREARRAAAASAARRRRRVLLVLLLAVAGVGAAVALGALPTWAPAVPGALVLGFLVLARVLVRRERAAWDADVRRARPDAEAGGDAYPAELLPQATDAEGTPVVSATEDTAAFDRGLLATAVATTDSASLWDPLPVTLPTYVGKARAPRSVRTIDLRDPSISSSGRDEADSALVAETEAAAAETAEQDAAPRRAVGS